MSGSLNNIYNNINFALDIHAKAMNRLQEQVSTGSQINRTSDDPSTAYKILGLNSQQRSIDGYINSLSELVDTLEISSNIVEDMTSAIAEAKTLLTRITGGSYNEGIRETTAEGINEILEHIVLLANTKHSDQYLFGGSNTTSMPYHVERNNGEIISVTYQGSSENRQVEVSPGVMSSAFYVGDDIFCSDNRSEPVFLGETGAKAGTGTSTVEGSTWLTVTGSAGNYTLSIDDGLSTFNTDGTNTNLAVTDSRTGEILYVDTTEINGTGVELVSIPGTYNIFNALIGARDLLRNERGLSEGEITELRSNSLDALEEVRSILSERSVSIGTKIGFMENLNTTLENMKFNTEDETTRLQEADIAQIAIDLSRREVLYEMSLSVAGKLLSMSLLDFI
jgi:flagellar hook-associated protein 3 FlgL